MPTRVAIPATQREFVYAHSNPVTGFMPEPLAQRVFMLLKPNVVTTSDADLDVLWLDIIDWLDKFTAAIDAAEAAFTS